MPPLSDDDMDRLANRVVDQIVDKRRAQWVDPETHHEHHAWVGEQLSKEQQYSDLRQKIITSACIWAVPIILAFVFSSMWRELVRLLQKVLLH